MNEIHTISEFFTRTHTAFQAFDMGRRVVALPAVEYAAFEAFESPYACPLQQQAWFGLLCWSQQSEDDHSIWFLRMPLDEFACMVPAARHDFIYRLLEQLGSAIESRESSEAMHGALEQSPYGFKPKQNRMAVFHAKASRFRELPPSRYYAATRDYLAGKLGYEQWQFLGVQGLADVAARWDIDDNHERLCAAIARMPQAPWSVLSECLENEMLDESLTRVIVNRTESALQTEQGTVAEVCTGIRAISMAVNSSLRIKLLESVLQHTVAQEVEVLAAISGRCWEDLKNPHLCHSFLESLAHCLQGEEVFQAVLADLMFIPGMRKPLRQSLEHATVSKPLATAWERFCHKTQAS